MNALKTATPLVFAFASLAIASTASAELCAQNGRNVIYVAGSSSAKPFLAAIARAMFVESQPVTIAYAEIESCSGVSAILNATPISGTAIYWDPAKPEHDNEVECTIGTATVAANVVADIGVSDVFASSCFDLPNGLPATIGDFFGPIQTMAFVVPKASSERSISASGAYFVFGFGDGSGVEPWDDKDFIFRRNISSGTQAMVARAIGVPSEKFKGIDTTSNAKMIESISRAIAPSKSIGILAATEINDAVRLQVSVLAYKHFGQNCAYFPDAFPSGKDKVNVRDGHYSLWGPVHLLSRLDDNGYVKDPRARRVVGMVTGSLPPPAGVNLIAVEAMSTLVPSCAMSVERKTEVGPLMPFAPENGCGCYFEQVASGTPGPACQACSRDSECPLSTPKCSFGFCEER